MGGGVSSRPFVPPPAAGGASPGGASPGGASGRRLSDRQVQWLHSDDPFLDLETLLLEFDDDRGFNDDVAAAPAAGYGGIVAAACGAFRSRSRDRAWETKKAVEKSVDRPNSGSANPLEERWGALLRSARQRPGSADARRAQAGRTASRGAPKQRPRSARTPSPLGKFGSPTALGSSAASLARSGANAASDLVNSFFGWDCRHCHGHRGVKHFTAEYNDVVCGGCDKPIAADTAVLGCQECSKYVCERCSGQPAVGCEDVLPLLVEDTPQHLASSSLASPWGSQPTSPTIGPTIAIPGRDDAEQAEHEQEGYAWAGRDWTEPHMFDEVRRAGAVAVAEEAAGPPSGALPEAAAGPAAAARAAGPQAGGEGFRLHMLFSSPLCMAQPLPVHIQLAYGPGGFGSAAQLRAAAEAEVEAWNLEFDPWPHVVWQVRPTGKVAEWNARQEQVKYMLRPRDELHHLAIGGVKELLRDSDYSPAATLEKLLSRADLSSGGDAAGGGCGPGTEVTVTLLFWAKRAVEALQIEDELEAISKDGCELVARPATVRNFRDLIAGARCCALHLALHCSVELQHWMVFEEDTGLAHYLHAKNLREFLTQGQAEQSIRLVFINACHSYSLGSLFVEAGVRHVVCVRDENEVLDRSCRAFACDFWTAVRAGRSVREAFECGRAPLRFSSDAAVQRDAESFVLLPLGAAHSEVLRAPCDAAAAPAPRRSPAPTPWGGPTAPIEGFLGREVDLQELLRASKHRRFVELRGERGVGKTALLREAARFLALRWQSFGEVLYISSNCRREECVSRLEGLRRQLQEQVLQCALLLVDNAEVFALEALGQLLRCSAISVVDASGCQKGCELAMESGLQPMPFALGPLEPVSQVQLFYKQPNAGRLLARELSGGGAHAEAVVAQPKRPARYMELAETPFFRGLAGNPQRILEAALRLQRGSAAAAAGAAGAWPAAAARVALQPGSEIRKVRLVHPDGRNRDTLLRASSTVRELLDGEHCPRDLGGLAGAYVDGCQAAQEAKLSDLPEHRDHGMLVVEFRRRLDDW